VETQALVRTEVAAVSRAVQTESSAVIRSRVVANIAESTTARSSGNYGQFARFNTALDFYSENGYKAGDALSHMAGIDFKKPVSVVKLNTGDNLLQFGFPNKPIGSYFAREGVNPSALGINIQGRVPTTFTMPDTARALQSTAADTSSIITLPPWARGAGGEIQLFSPEARNLLTK
jgi:hypothetical protein